MYRTHVKSLLALACGLLASATGCASRRPAPDPRSETEVTGASTQPAAPERPVVDKTELDQRARSERAKIALDRLTPFAAVRELPESGGVVVVIADSVLFEGNGAELMATARERLDRVVEALRDVQPRSIVIKGHMDRSGDDRRDLDLSRRRATAVRAHLISRAIHPDRVLAEGLGHTEPASSNASTEGRNANRRIELIVEGPGLGAPKH